MFDLLNVERGIERYSGVIWDELDRYRGDRRGQTSKDRSAEMKGWGLRWPVSVCAGLSLIDSGTPDT